MKAHLSPTLSLIALLTAGLCGAAESGNMIGNQSQNEGLPVLPTPGKVVIDGALDDWDTSGRIWVFADSGIRTRYSTEVSAMHDAEYLYIAVRWKDPTPMFSTVDPAFNSESGWKSDSMQMRIDAEDQVSWLTTWYFTEQQRSIVHKKVWNDPNDMRKNMETSMLVGKPKETELGEGVAQAYRADADGAGFVQELRLPWKYICPHASFPADKRLRIGFEFLWGDPTGSTWPIHRYADNMAPGHTSREFFWSAKKAWGFADILDHGKVAVRQYINQSNRLEGSIPLTLEIPAAAARFTVVIEDTTGKRIRNLIGDADPIDYSTAITDAKRTCTVSWDGLDDAGDPVAPGTYQVRGLTQSGLGAAYQQCFYNPGTPPWQVREGTGSWAADHSPVSLVARAGERMALASIIAEGGDGIFMIGADGQKLWGEKRGAQFLCANEQFVYAFSYGHGNKQHEAKKSALIRLAAADGAYRAFVAAGEERPFELSLAAILGKDESTEVVDLASAGEELLIARSDSIVVLDAASAAVKRTLTINDLQQLSVAGDGTWYVVTAAGVSRVDPQSGAMTAITLSGVGQIADLSTDLDNNIVLLDNGPDQQTKVFNPKGELQYTCARKGGRPIRGDFIPEAISHGSSIATDATGNVWVTEAWNYPRRTSVWNRTGSLVRDYIGNTGYAGTGCFLHDQDPDLAYVGPIEIRLDREKHSWEVERVLWVPDPSKGEGFEIGTGEHAHPVRFRAKVAGKMREFLFAPPYRDYNGYVIYMEGDNHAWRPVAAITTAARIGATDDPSSPVNGLNPKQGLIWNDDDGDGVVDKPELITVDKLPLGSGWGSRIDQSSFTIYVNGVNAYTPIGFADDGAPRFGPESLASLGVDERGDFVPVPEEKRLLCLSFKGYAGPTRLLGIDSSNGSVQWTYPNPYPGVHGSHRATMPKPGLLIGPLKILGVADIGGDTGRIFALRGNLGQDFYFTTDGLMIGTMFQDGRLPSASLPDSEERLYGMPMEGFSNGGEPFNGWLGKHDDGVVRLTTGMPRQAAMILQVSGLDSVKRFTAPPVSLDAQAIAKALQDNAERAAAKVGPAVHFVPKVATKLADGDWNGMPGITLARHGMRDGAHVQFVHDANHLYVRYTVTDTSPWKNAGKDLNRLFKTGDAVDLQMGTGTGNAPGANDYRIVISQLDQKPVAVLMKAVDAKAPEVEHHTYSSPVGDKKFDRVAILKEADITLKKQAEGYTVTVGIPFKAIGVDFQAGMKLRGDVGLILSDADGTINTARFYWANQHTNLVNDEPQEAWYSPSTWGEFTLE